jgi:hypothetical protein
MVFKRLSRRKDDLAVGGRSAGVHDGFDELVGGLGEAFLKPEEGIGSPHAVPFGGENFAGEAGSE